MGKRSGHGSGLAERENERQNRECDEEEIEEVRFVVKIRTLCRDEIAGRVTLVLAGNYGVAVNAELRRSALLRGLSGLGKKKRKQLPKRKLL